jgi:hypothetical protein
MEGATASALDLLALLGGGVVGGLDVGLAFVSSHFSYSGGVHRPHGAVMFAWLRPHSSAHWPVKTVPASLPGS